MHKHVHAPPPARICSQRLHIDIAPLRRAHSLGTGSIVSFLAASDEVRNLCRAINAKWVKVQPPSTHAHGQHPVTDGLRARVLWFHEDEVPFHRSLGRHWDFGQLRHQPAPAKLPHVADPSRNVGAAQRSQSKSGHGWPKSRRVQTTVVTPLVHRPIVLTVP